MVRLFPLFFLLLFSPALFSQTFTWNGSVSSDWATSVNWTPNGIPGGGHTVQINSDAVPNTCVLDGDRSIAVLTLSAGSLNLNGFRLTTTTSASCSGGVLNAGGGTLSTPSLTQLSGTVFNGSFTLEKSGTTNSTPTGGNTFNGPVVISNAGSGRLRMSNTTGDVFNDDAHFINQSTGSLDIGYRDDNYFFGNLTLDNSSTGGMTVGGSNTVNAISEIASGGALLTNGFSNGRLILRRMTQFGTSPNGSFSPSLFTCSYTTLGGDISVHAASTTMTLNNCSFTASATLTAESNIAISGTNAFSTVSGSTVITRNGGTTNSTWAGGDSFGNLTLINNSTYNIRLCGVSGNTYSGTTEFINTNSGALQISYNGASVFTGDMILTNSGTGGMTIGMNGGTTTQSAGAMLTNGFTDGPLAISYFTQSSTDPNDRLNPTTCTIAQSSYAGDFAMTTTAGTLTINTCQFTGTNSFISATNIAVNNSNTFSPSSGNTSFTISGGGNTSWAGGNTFGDLNIYHNSSSYLRMGTSSADDYNGNVLFVRQAGGTLQPAYSGSHTFAGDISTVGSVAAVQFGQGGGTIVLDGDGSRSWDAPPSTLPSVTNFQMNTGVGGELNLNVPLYISTSLTMTSGFIRSTASEPVHLTDESATANTGNSNAFIDGPMWYTMNSNAGTRSTLNFPIGKDSDWRPVTLAVSHTNTTSYTYEAELSNSSALDLGFSLPPTVNLISQIHYWTVTRYRSSTMLEDPSANLRTTAGVEPEITLYFGENDFVYDGADLVVCKNTPAAPTTWIDIGGTGAPPYAGGSALSGSVTSTSSPSAFNSFSIFTLGSFSENPLPISLLHFDAEWMGSAVAVSWSTASEINSAYFEVERSTDGVQYDPIGRLNAAGNSTALRQYSLLDDQPLGGYSYYRLKQVDNNGDFSYSAVRTIFHAVESGNDLYPVAFPNPFAEELQVINPLPWPENTRFRVWNAQGQLMMDSGQPVQTTAQWSTAAWPKGWYILAVESPGQSVRIPLCRQ